jgi:hypothetical protein
VPVQVCIKFKHMISRQGKVPTRTLRAAVDRFATFVRNAGSMETARTDWRRAGITSLSNQPLGS